MNLTSPLWKEGRDVNENGTSGRFGVTRFNQQYCIVPSDGFLRKFLVYRRNAQTFTSLRCISGGSDFFRRVFLVPFYFLEPHLITRNIRRCKWRLTRLSNIMWPRSGCSATSSCRSIQEKLLRIPLKNRAVAAAPIASTTPCRWAIREKNPAIVANLDNWNPQMNFINLGAAIVKAIWFSCVISTSPENIAMFVQSKLENNS